MNEICSIEVVTGIAPDHAQATPFVDDNRPVYNTGVKQRGSTDLKLAFEDLARMSIDAKPVALGERELMPVRLHLHAACGLAHHQPLHSAHARFTPPSRHHGSVRGGSLPCCTHARGKLGSLVAWAVALQLGMRVCSNMQRAGS